MAVTTASGATWQEVATDRQRYRDETIAAIEPALPDILSPPLNVTPIAKDVLTEEELRITESKVEELAPQLAKGYLSAVTVVKAFLRRAALAQKLVRCNRSSDNNMLTSTFQTNCVTELLPSRALERAEYLDDYLKTNGKPVGPFHGIPISVKEHIGMKDLDNNAGFITWVGNVPTEDAHILQILWNSGAVFYVRTTQPQTLMHLETSSNLYGFVETIEKEKPG